MLFMSDVSRWLAQMSDDQQRRQTSPRPQADCPAFWDSVRAGFIKRNHGILRLEMTYYFCVMGAKFQRRANAFFSPCKWEMSRHRRDREGPMHNAALFPHFTSQHLNVSTTQLLTPCLGGFLFCSLFTVQRSLLPRLLPDHLLDLLQLRDRYCIQYRLDVHSAVHPHKPAQRML